MAALVTLCTCGGETVLLVEVDLSNHAVPAEVDLIHLELRDEADVLGRNFPLTFGDQRPVFELVVGPRTPTDVTLVGYAFLGVALVSESPPEEVAIQDGEQVTVRLVVP